MNKDILQDPLLQNKKKPLNDTKTKIIAIFTISILALIILTVILSQNGEVIDSKVFPTKIKMTLSDTKSTIMKLGTGRVVNLLYYSGFDDRSSQKFKVVTQRQVKWQITPKGIIDIDPYGRIEALSIGKVTLKVTSIFDNAISDSKQIQVIQKKQGMIIQQRVINYKGKARPVQKKLQRSVDRLTKQEALDNQDVPQSIKDAFQKGQYKQTVKNDEVQWKICKYTDGSPRTYVTRTSKVQKNNRDSLQYFIGSRYLPGSGLNVVSIQTDNSNGLWTTDENGSTTHIKMIDLTYLQKAKLLVEETQKNVLRHGLAASASRNGDSWKPSVTDNDGLWTSMYAAGQLMRYAVLQQKGDDKQIELARTSAIKSLKAVLLVANVAGRDKVVEAKVRRFYNNRSRGLLTSEYLKQGEKFTVRDYPGSPADGIGFFGEGAGSTIDGSYYGGSQKYTYTPFNQQSWTLNGKPALTKRSLNGFMARTIVIPELEPGFKDQGGLYFKRNQNGTQTVISGANKLYDYTKTDHPQLDLGNLPLPEVLTDLQKIGNRNLIASDMVYKGDTSSDELIGQMFLFKIAFDTLNKNDPVQLKLKELIGETMGNLAQMFISNNYEMVDATGQGTTWNRLTRQFINSDYTLQDGPLKGLQILLVFKLAAYVTGDQQWKRQYELLVTHEAFKYADLAATSWDRWAWRVFNEDDSLKQGRIHISLPKDQISQLELERHHMHQDHYSDDEEALLAYYLLFQLEDDPILLQKYKAGLNGYWRTISQSQTALWYYIYQLSDPNNLDVKDRFNNHILDVSSWSLSRYPTEMTTYPALVIGSRPDLFLQGQLSVKNKVLGQRKSPLDIKYVNRTDTYSIQPDYRPENIYEIYPLPQDERSLHKYNGVTFENPQNGNPNDKEAATLFTLPLWLGVYHNMLQIDS